MFSSINVFKEVYMINITTVTKSEDPDHVSLTGADHLTSSTGFPSYVHFQPGGSKVLIKHNS